MHVRTNVQSNKSVCYITVFKDVGALKMHSCGRSGGSDQTDHSETESVQHGSSCLPTDKNDKREGFAYKTTINSSAIFKKKNRNPNHSGQYAMFMHPMIQAC